MTIGVLGGLGVLVGTARCTRNPGLSQSIAPSTLRVGVGGLPQQAADSGLAPLVGSLSVEPLAAPNDDGRMRPSLAKDWTTSPDGLSVTVRIYPGATFHDGTPVSGRLVAAALNKDLPRFMGPAFEDISQIRAVDDSSVRFELRRPSPFVVEALETAITKPGATQVGTGAFVAGATGAPTVLKANPNYYREHPAISEISIAAYPTARAAWAELLRGNLDMLFEVGIDALDSLQRANNVAVFSFSRHYQYTILFGPNSMALRSPEVRRALSAAIDREAIVREALNGHGLASSGPVKPDHWAFNRDTRPALNRELAKTLAGRHLTFSCLVPADSVYERVALAVRQQLAAISVDMQVVQASQQQVRDAAQTGNFEALLGDIVSGPTILRSFRQFDSRMHALPKIPSAAIDAALDRIRHAASDDEYRLGVAAFEQAMADEPPALFLAWGERARAVSRRFDVPALEKGRDVLTTIRLWRPVPQAGSTN
jgi:peptide/nickel transport system substrate-binding protein